MSKINRWFLAAAVLFFYMLATSTSCVRLMCFKNCTNDTLYICASHYDNIDSVDCQLEVEYSIPENSILDTTDVSLWERRKIGDYYADFIPFKDLYIFPDSSCVINDYYFYDKDKPGTTYFFLVKWSDAKKYSWDEIRENKLYRKWVVTRNKKGEFDRNIRYTDSANP